MTEPTQRDRIVAALTLDESPLRVRFVDVVLDFILALRVDALIDVETTQELISDGLSEENALRYIDRHGLPGWDRYVARAEATQETLGAFVPEAVQTEIDRLLADVELPEAKWTGKVFEPSLVRELLTPVVQDTLVNFAKKLPIPGLGSLDSATGGGLSALAGRFKKSASGAFDVGRGVLGGLGADLERRVQQAARDFSATAMSEGRTALQERLKSPEGRRIMSEIRRHFIRALMETTLAELNEDTVRYPVADLTRLAPAVIAQSMQTTFMRDAIREEIEAVIAVEGERRLVDLLDESGLTEAVRGAIAEVWGVHFRDFFGSDAFGGWLDDVLAL